jgi:hypothetical protein
MINQGNQMNIELYDLTDTQCVIADFLWEVETNEDLQAIIDVFGEREVLVLQDMMLAAALDEVEDVAAAAQVLSKFV